jgi:Protein of unknown function (DUF1587)./Protein of unknown function (DUF1592)./Protein of unknown function (DUF1595)./Protein of unknown function (DUF1588)./Protein of unknown function (DUF1585).
MLASRRKLALAIGMSCMLTGGFGSANAQTPDYSTALNELKSQWSTLETYCLGCHNFDDYAGGQDFSLITPEEVPQHAEAFELALKKLRGSVMPPPSQKQPSEEERWKFITALENLLDANAAQHPDPGRVGLHRLNRTEYVNAIKQITGVELDPEFALPKDDNSDGFDNIANVLKVSPAFLDQYIAAARLVSERAVGSPSPRTESVFYAADPARQSSHIDGLPLGTRGGLLVEHEFLVGGDYKLTIPGLASAGYALGMEYEHDVIITLNGEEIFRRSIGGPEDLRKLDQEQAPAVAEINARFKDIPITVRSGKYQIGVAFVARSFAQSDEFLHSLNGKRGMERIARLRGLEVAGPFSTDGIVDTEARRKVMICEPQDASQELDCARRIFANLAKQAFRRPVSDADLDAPLRFFAEGREQGTFDDGIKNGMLAIFTSPKFLFRAEIPGPDAQPGSVVPISEQELASRLAFFLWSSPPDEELIDLAAQNKLRADGNLRKQIARMLADPRSESLVENFIFQWLRLRELENIDPDPALFPNFNNALLEAFREEIRLFAGDLIKRDAPIHELLTSNETYLNEDLALHYGFTDIRGDKFRKVVLPQEERRGLLGKGAVLMVTSYANRTTPVIRGAFIMENFMGVPPAAPPPNVEAFPETPEGATVALTVRERLEMHRNNPACAGCHDVMDPLGLSLENFDAIGQWRERDRDAGNAPIDSSGRLANGKPIQGVNDLRNALVARPDQFAHVIVEKMLMYALGRGVEAHDMPTVRAIVHKAAADDYRFSAIIEGIIASDQFQMMSVPQDGAVIGAR